MSTLRPQDRVSLCRFTFADGRQCRTPRAANHPYFCFDHARKEAQARVAENLGNDLAYFFSGEYLSACDLTTAIGRLIPAVVRGDIKPKAAGIVAYLAQTLVQAIPLAQQEYNSAVGSAPWSKTIRDGIVHNFRHRFPTPLPQSATPDPDPAATPPPQPPNLAPPLVQDPAPPHNTVEARQ